MKTNLHYIQPLLVAALAFALVPNPPATAAPWVSNGPLHLARYSHTATLLPLNPGGHLTLTGSGFRGVSEGSGGDGSQASPGDRPVVQLRSIANGQVLFLSSTNWQTNSFVSLPVADFPAGWALATVFVNGIPSNSSILIVGPTALTLTNPGGPANGSFQFAFDGTPGAAFTALATTNVSLPLSNWNVLGSVPEVAPGRFQFIDSQAPGHPQRFYRVRSP